MIKEIGGFIEFEHYQGHFLHEEGIKLNSAQNALRYLIREERITKIWLPFYLCESVCSGCKKEGIDVGFYHIDERLLPVVPTDFCREDWLYIVNYYGQMPERTISELQRTYGHVILDDVQAYYHSPECKVPTIYSCRKFFGVSDGGILCNVASDPGRYPRDLSWDRMKHLLGRFERDASSFYGDYVANDEYVGNTEITRMSLLTQNLLRAVDYERVRDAREANYRYLHRALKGRNRLVLDEGTTGPFMYPLWIANGPEVRKRLIQRKIYIPKLWPLDYHVAELSLERELENNILPIPCDQRYSKHDMDIILQALASIAIA